MTVEAGMGQLRRIALEAGRERFAALDRAQARHAVRETPPGAGPVAADGEERPGKGDAALS